MNVALWRKAFRDARLQLAVSAVLLVLFGWLFVWLTSLFQPKMVAALLNLMPKFMEPLLGVPLAKLATTTGRLSVLYVHVVPLLVCIGWAVGRGSDLVSGEISRGTMDLLATLPIRRWSVVAVSAAVTTLGAAALAFSIWAGQLLGIRTVTLPDQVDPAWFVPGAINLFAMTVCLAGLTSLFSSWDRSRWRTILLAGGCFAVCSVIKMVARLWQPGAWLKYFSFLTAFEPQQLILLDATDPARPSPWSYNATLLAIGLGGYVLAAILFSCRDIPAAY